MKGRLLKGMLILSMISIVGNLPAQLPPQQLEWEQVGRNTAKILWKMPNDAEKAGMYAMQDWKPESSFYYKEPLLVNTDYYLWEKFATDGKRIVSISPENRYGYLSIYDMEGNYLEDIFIPGVPFFYDITSDGKYFYGVRNYVSGISSVYKIDIDSRKIVSIIELPNIIINLCYVPDLNNNEGGFLGDAMVIGDDAVYSYAMDGTPLDLVFDIGEYDLNAQIVGTGYYDGKVYFYCQGLNSYKILYEYDASTGKSTGNSLDLNIFSGEAGLATGTRATAILFFEMPKGPQVLFGGIYAQAPSEFQQIASIFQIGGRNFPENLQGYNIYRDDTKLNEELIQPEIFWYSDTDLLGNTEYEYSLTGVYIGGESQSNSIKLTLDWQIDLPFTEKFETEKLSGLSGEYWSLENPDGLEIQKLVNTIDINGANTTSLQLHYPENYVFPGIYNSDFSGTQNLKLTLNHPEGVGSASSMMSVTIMEFDVICVTDEALTTGYQPVLYTYYSTSGGTGNGLVPIQTVLAQEAGTWKRFSVVLNQGTDAYTSEVQLKGNIRGAFSAPHTWYIDNIHIRREDRAASRYAGTLLYMGQPLAGYEFTMQQKDYPYNRFSTTTGNEGSFDMGYQWTTYFPAGKYKLTASDGINTYTWDDFELAAVPNPYGSIPSINDAVINMPGISLAGEPLEITLSPDKRIEMELPFTVEGGETIEWNTSLEYENIAGKSDMELQGSVAWKLEYAFDVDEDDHSYTFHKGYFYKVDMLEDGIAYLNKYTISPVGFNFLEQKKITSASITPNTNTAGNQPYLMDGRELLYLSICKMSENIIIPIDIENGIVYEEDVIKSAMPTSYGYYLPEEERFIVGFSGGGTIMCIDKSGDIISTSMAANYNIGIAYESHWEGGPFVLSLSIETKSDSPMSTGINRRRIINGVFEPIVSDQLINGLNYTNFGIDLFGDEFFNSNRTAVTPINLSSSTVLIPGHYSVYGIIKRVGAAQQPADARNRFFVYNLYPIENWLNMEEQHGSAEPGTNSSIRFTLNSEGLEPGTVKEGTLIVNAAGNIVEIPVKLTVSGSRDDGCKKPVNLTASITTDYKVNLAWEAPSATNIKGYNVYCGNRQINDGLVTTTQYQDNMPGMGEQQYTVVAVYETGCISIDSDIASIEVINPALVNPVKDLQAGIINKRHVELSWTSTPALPGVFDDFESYIPFSINESIHNWKLIDGDKATTGTTQLGFPNEGEKISFMAYNCSIVYGNTQISYDGKEQFLVSHAPQYRKEIAKDDWIISQELNFDEPFFVSFVAKTYDGYSSSFETINIGYSTNGIEPEDFVFVNGDKPVYVPEGWTQFEFRIPAEAKYVAINCFGKGKDRLFLDNLFIGYPQYYTEVESYNIYRNGEKINTNPYTTSVFRDYELENGNYTYEVEVIYTNGTSAKTSVDMTIDFTREISAPRNLTGAYDSNGNAINLNWAAPIWTEVTEIRYDDGIPVNSVGFSYENYEYAEWMALIRFESEDLIPYAGYSLTGIQFHIEEYTPYIIPIIYENGVAIRTGKEFTPQPGEYNTYTFDNPVLIEAGNEYAVGYLVKQEPDFYPVSHDAGIIVKPGKSDLFSFGDGSWYSMYYYAGASYYFNWNIAGIVEMLAEVEPMQQQAIPMEQVFRAGLNNVPKPVGIKFRAAAGKDVNKVTGNVQEDDRLLGYNVYRNDQKITETLLTSRVFSDNNPYEGNNEYYVTAVYGSGQELKSNTFALNLSGIEENMQENVRFYPNPATDKLYIRGVYDSLSLVSLDGKEVYQKQYAGENITEINVSHLEAGTYLLIIRNSNILENHKVIIN